MNSFSFVSPVASTASGLTKAWRDPIKVGDNNGIRCIYDLGFGWSYPGGNPTSRAVTPPTPIAAATVYDASLTGNNATIGINASDTGLVTYSGGGFDLTSITQRADCITIPSAVFTDIWTGIGGVSQSWLVCAYIKLPAAASLNSGTNYWLQWGQQNSIQTPLSMEFNSSAQIGAIRQATGAHEGAFVTPNASDYTTVVQVAAWRYQGGKVNLSYQGTHGSATAVGTLTTEGDTSPTSMTGEFGATTAGWGIANAARTGFRLYRLWIDNLARDTRTPSVILAQDYAATVARGVFS